MQSHWLNYLQQKPKAEASYPFGEGVLVYKVCGKIFAIISEKSEPVTVNLKCDPEEARMLRDIFPAVLPGYHMNKRHWNTVVLDESLPVGEVERMMDNSYELVVKGLTKAQRQHLSLLMASLK